MNFKPLNCSLLLVLMLTGCSSKQAQPESTTEQAQMSKEISIEPAKDSAANDTLVDAMTAATSRPNQVSLNGTIVIPPQHHATVSLTMGGIIRNTTMLPGQYVNKGAVLATLENPDFILLQQNYLESYAQTEFLQKEYNRQKTLSDQQAASLKKFEQTKADYLSMKSRLEATEAQLSLLGVTASTLQTKGIAPLLEVKAPISGYIGQVDVNTGKYIQAGEALCDIIDKRVPMLRLTTYEKDIQDLRLGDIVEFQANGMPGKNFEAKIVSIGQQVDEVNRSLQVYAQIINSHQEFRPGMYVTARIKWN